MAEAPGFSYDLAFDRNIGWVTEWEQQALRGKCVAIAGMGGVGGVDLLTLARFGIGAFHIADFDRFEIANFNRQIGASVETLGRPKAEVLDEMARGINPELRMTRFDSGVDSQNLDRFLEGVDLFVDGLDFFVLGIRRQIFARCAELGIPAVTAAPIGMGAGFVAFMPGGMSFEQYFRLEGQSEEKQYVRFLMGMAPRGLHRSYLVDPTRVDLAGRRGPSTIAACQLCAGITAVAAVKLLLGRGDVKPAPYHHHFDAYRGKLAVTKLRFGNAGPLQRIKIAIAERAARAMSMRASVASEAYRPSSPVEEILNAARWAPSGDNSQPWRFQLLGNDGVIVRVSDESDHDVYEYRNAEPTLISTGMLLESMRLAATARGRGIECQYDGLKDRRHQITVRFPSIRTETDPLYSYLTLRSVDRRPYRMRRLTSSEIAALEQALGSEFAVDWHHEIGVRWKIAKLGAQATDIRLRIPEAFAIHKRVIDWDHDHSPAGIPARAAGLDAMSTILMRWAMQDWSRMQWLNRFGGAFMAALQMDYLPGLASAAFFTIRFRDGPPAPHDRPVALLRAGQGIQRFWLTATKLRLAVHPGLAVLAFAHYGDISASFTADPAMQAKAKTLAADLRRTLANSENLIFIGRIGEPRPRVTLQRSTRRPLPDLMDRPATE